MTGKRNRTRTYLSSQDRRARIVEAAFRCLQEHGHARLTARRIAEASGISLGHITYNFRDMNEVLLETYRHASRRLYEATQAELDMAPQAAADRLRAFLRTGFTAEFLKKDYVRVRIDLWSAALRHEEIARTELALYRRYRDQLVLLLEQVADERGLPRDGVAMLADTIMAVLDGLWLDWERRQNGEAVENGLEGCLRLVDAVLGVDAGASGR